MYSLEDKVFFEENGYLKLQNILTNNHLGYYEKIYNNFINNKYNTTGLRSDLSGEKDGKGINYTNHVTIKNFTSINK